jgi:hypothetical protein
MALSEISMNHKLRKIERLKGETAMPEDESLPEFTSEKPCPRCGELLYWSSVELP